MVLHIMFSRHMVRNLCILYTHHVYGFSFIDTLLAYALCHYLLYMIKGTVLFTYIP